MHDERWDGERASARTSLRLPTPVLDTRTGRFLSGQTRDLSAHGVFVELNEHPPVGALVEMFVGGMGVGAQVVGRVVRVVDGEGFAAAFTSDASAIHKFLPAQL